MNFIKLSLDEFEEDQFALIAVHSSLEDYRLAYMINDHLNTQLKRVVHDVAIGKNQIKFPLFEWENQHQDELWNLIPNLTLVKTTKATDEMTLFGTETEQTSSHYLIKEKKRIDYFIKITDEPNESRITSIIGLLNKIPSIITAYQVVVDELKSKTNLIFE